MKTLLSLTYVLAITFSMQAIAGDDVSSMVQDELKKTQTEVAHSLTQANQRLSELRAAKERALLDSKKLGEEEIKGKDLMDKYALLLFSRYRNEKNEFEVGMIISEKDQENINKLFRNYLASQPLRAQTSAGEAKRVLESGSKNLTEIAKLHLNPSEKNNSQLEILDYQVKNAELSLKRSTELANTLGGVTPKAEPKIERNTASK